MKAWLQRLRARWVERGTPSNHPFHDVVPSGADWRGLPTPECMCGGRTFYAVVWFDDDREVGGYVLDGLCTDCHALLTLPTPLDMHVLEAFNDE